jgi:hypothetical protein
MFTHFPRNRSSAERERRKVTRLHRELKVKETIQEQQQQAAASFINIMRITHITKDKGASVGRGELIRC